MTRRLLFHRDFRAYQGGHGKVRDYVRHAAAHPAWTPEVYLTPHSSRDDNPFLDAPLAADWQPVPPDALFLAGRDWRAWPEDRDDISVVNLIQHVRHATPGEPTHAYLRRRAIRLCVSQPVADAILATGQVRGPVFTIDAAINLPLQADTGASRAGIVVGALKQPALGAELAALLRAQGRHVRLLDAPLPREAYLSALAKGEIAVLLPHATEGFYLPALEAMALGCATVVPDCTGNRAYLAPERNALVPDLTPAALAAAVERLDDAGLRARLREAGIATATHFNQQRERAAFHAMLDDLPALWEAA